MLEQAVAESRHQRAGSAAVLERVSEMVFVDAARRYLESLPEEVGLLAGLQTIDRATAGRLAARATRGVIVFGLLAPVPSRTDRPITALILHELAPLVDLRLFSLLAIPMAAAQCVDIPFRARALWADFSFFFGE